MALGKITLTALSKNEIRANGLSVVRWRLQVPDTEGGGIDEVIEARWNSETSTAELEKKMEAQAQAIIDAYPVNDTDMDKAITAVTAKLKA